LTPAVSVIIPTYQRRDMVARAVRSVLAQTYRDFELIVVDDGSTDGTAESLEALGGRVLYAWQPNRGVSAARNAGLRLARGRIVAFLDSDDRWLPDHLEILTGMLARHPAAVLASTSPKRLIGGSASPEKAYLYDPLPVYFFAITFGYPSCVAVRRDAVQAAGGFDEHMQVHEAVDLFTRLAIDGPFCMLQRRTIVKHYTSGLKEWGRLSGNYLEVFEYRARRALDQLAGANGSRQEELLTQAEAALALASAMRALEGGDEPAVRERLTEACRLAPQLSTEVEVVRDRLEYMPRAHEPAERLRHLECFGRLWPEPSSDAALYLRACAMGAALRQRNLGIARRLFADWPLRRTPSFARAALPEFRRRARRSMDARRHRAQDGVDLGARATPAPIASQSC
jgi:GT2 family glycosyltransferase